MPSTLHITNGDDGKLRWDGESRRVTGSQLLGDA